MSRVLTASARRTGVRSTSDKRLASPFTRHKARCSLDKRGCREQRRAVILRAEGKKQSTAVEGKQSQPQAGVDDSTDVESQTAGQSNKWQMLSELSLFVVAAFWGTNPVCLRYVYRLGEPPSPSALAAIQAAGAALLLTLINASKPESDAGAEQLHSGSEARKTPDETGWGRLLQADTVVKAGVEIGFWTFLANSATISAFEHTPASRGAFLIRLTAVFTPLVAWLSGQSPSGREWGACAIALAGGILISLDSALKTADATGDAVLGIGDAVMILSAFLWAVQTVRLGQHATNFAPLSLAQNQAIALAGFSALWLAADALYSPGHSPLGSLFSNSTEPLIWAAVVWPAIGPWGIGTALQVRAQGTVSPSRTQIVLATDPIWATGFAGLLGGVEQSLGALGWFGAACILSASIVSRR